MTVTPARIGGALRLSVGLVAIVLATRAFVVIGWLAPVVVAGDSMRPFLAAGDRIVVRRWSTPRRWDPVVLRSPTDARRLVVKRVVGLPGERVRLLDGGVWIDGNRVEPPNESAARGVYYGAWGNPEWRLEADAWLVVGDNTAVSVDSRNWDHAPGVPGRLLVGVVAE